MRKFFERIFWTIIILTVTVNVLATLSMFLPPEYFWFLGYLGLGYPLIFFATLIIVIGLFLTRKFYPLAIVLVILGVTSDNIFQTFSFHPIKQEIKEEQKTIKIMSYNVKLFRNDKHGDVPTNLETIAKYVIKENPDIVFFQEFGWNKYTQSRFLDIVAKKGYQYYAPKRGFGSPIISKYKIQNIKRVKFAETSNRCLQATVKIDGETFTLINTHLQSIFLGKADYEYIDDLANKTPDEVEIEGGKTILKKLRRGYLKRSVQAELLKGLVEKSEYPVILAGDFNDVPVSYAYRTIANSMKDSFIDAGFGIGRTYSEIAPFLRIDYILTSKDVKTLEYKTKEQPYSDHYPIQAVITLSNEAE